MATNQILINCKTYIAVTLYIIKQWVLITFFCFLRVLCKYLINSVYILDIYVVPFAENFLYKWYISIVLSYLILLWDIMMFTPFYLIEIPFNVNLYNVEYFIFFFLFVSVTHFQNQNLYIKYSHLFLG